MCIDLIIIIVLLLVGIGLLILETFFIPGFGIAGIAGIAFFAGGIMFAFSSLGAKGGTITLSASMIITAALFIWLIKSSALDRLALKTHISSSVADEKHSKIEPGDHGVTISRLNPIGKAMIKDEIVEAKSELGFIDENTPIEVISVHPTQVIVKPLV
ncbi:NfeD family protein [Parabacteroides sp. FAFU027]|uniref:NfeD family protein n=1 Tax=Parabacteroides sp. FAFU027 TaxID=2922715 RepID=UPI001FAF3EC2|nr:NfeD family protein [Parabacteroides sp. FAFU027]